nr:MAG TPA: hypothetical protein [Caudoviricetes sp.]
MKMPLDLIYTNHKVEILDDLLQVILLLYDHTVV